MQSFGDDTLPFDLPGYRTDQQLYASATSRVYRALRQQDRRPVVLKVLGPADASPAQRARYQREYAITRSLDAPGVIVAYSLETYRDAPVLVLEDFGGASLDHWLAVWKSVGTEAFPLAAFLELAVRIAAALAAIHAAGVIHKDLNPANVVFDPDTGAAKIIDFGLATTLSRETPPPKNAHMIEGTLAYLAPEQTGRTNRTVDYRADFYALGATFYELLTGRPPFTAADPLELVHAHLAKIPVAPHVLNPAIPPALSDLVLKLLAKAPEERYQSARGLQRDLETCRRSWQRLGQIPDFALGRYDRAERFLIPEKLYGRAREVATLLAAFERAAQGHAQLLLVTGFAGVGKTAVINEVHEPIIRQRGYFVKGKFDQFNRNAPFSGWVQAFRDLVGQLLGESEAERQRWRSALLAALGESGQVILDLLPELERLIGPQSPVPELSGPAAQNRFHLLFRKFITVFTTAAHPLVVFLDDLQWADAASLHLLHLLLSENPTGYLLVLGAYRDNEVSSAHPLKLTLDEIEKTGAALDAITLAPLRRDDVNQLVADSLGCAPELASPLTEWVYRIARGNPFFNNQWLKALHDEGLIAFDDELGRWQCDLARVGALTLTDDVVVFMAAQLQKLPRETQEALKLAACIGNSFALDVLALVRERSPDETAADLWPAVQEGFVLPQGEVYPPLPGAAPDADANRFASNHSLALAYRFLHDRVQQAAYSLIPEDQKRAVHLRIGQLLLKNTAETQREDKIFEIVNQLDWGLESLTEPAARNELAQLNLMAGYKAKAATAFKAAWDYFLAGRRLLLEDCWQNQYELALKLYEASVEAAYLGGDFESMEKLTLVVLGKAKTIFDAIRVYEIKSQALAAQIKFLEAVYTNLQVLKSLGIVFPQQPSQDDILTALRETRSIYRDQSIPELIKLPLMTDPVQLAAMRILASLLPVAFLSIPQLYTLAVLKQVELSIQYGNTPVSAFGYASYGLVLCRGITDIEAGYQFGQLALDLLHRLDAKEWQCKVPSVVHAFVTPWKKSIRDTLIPLRSAYYSGLENGDFQYAGYSAVLYAAFAYSAGVEKELSELQRETVSLSESIYQLKQVTVYRYFQMLLQALHDTRAGRISTKYLKGDYYDEEMMLSGHLTNDWMGSFYVHHYKLLLSYLFGDYRQAVEDAGRVRLYIDAAKGFPYEIIFCLYDSLARLAANREKPQENPHELLLEIETNQAKLKTWAYYAPMNCLHKFDLVEAERHRTLGDKAAAIEAYDRAIAGARENGYLREVALANELAAQFYFDWGKEKVAAVYLREARDGYRRWGADAKVRQMEQRYSRLLVPDANSLDRLALLPASDTVRSTADAGHLSLDLLTAIKASQALAGEITLEPLLRRMMRLVLENAGAQRGALLLDRDGRWAIEAQGDAESDEIAVLQAQDPRISPAVSAAIVARVARTRTSVVLDDAGRSEEFGQDPYIVRERIKSVIGLPLINQGRLSGILYLENNLAPRAFTAERLELLELLSAQMALSLDNARLYGDLEAKVAERTRSLAEARDAADAANRAKSIFLANMSHELRTPLNAILGFSELMRREALAGRTALSAAQRDNLDIIHRSGEHLLSLINDVLDLSKIEAGRATYHPVECDLPELLGHLRDLFEQRATVKGLALQVRHEPGMPRYVRTDAAKLRQVLINLLGNAIKFTAEGEVRLDVVRLTKPAEDAGRCRLHFSVTDTGPGIDAEERAQLFRAFSQARAGLNAREGAGLGLAISRQFVRLLGGDIAVDSQPGRGSCFHFDLDFDAIAGAAPPRASAGRTVVGLASASDRPRVLVVDDQESNRRLLVQLLEPLGFAVAEAADGEDALRRWRDWSPALMLLDLRLPGLDGHEVARRVRAEDPARRVKILAITASAFDEERDRVLAAGCDDFLRKPFRDADLLEMIGRRLGLAFQYADDAAERAAAPPDAVDPARLRALPEWLQRQLHHAVLELDMQRTTALAEQVTASDPALGAWIADQARELRYDQLLNLLDGAAEHATDPPP